MAGSTFVIKDEQVTTETVLGKIQQIETRDATTMWTALSKDAFFETGLLPVDGTGLLSIRKGMGQTQIVYQHQPEKSLIMWGERERDPKAKMYHLAQPYRIIIGDIVNDSLLGARHFYSPLPITDLNQPLYHTNMPNTNCRGYGAGYRRTNNGNGVGWICIYHTDTYAGMELGQQIRAMLRRAGGEEVYNNANMRETDGVGFYRDKYAEKLGRKAKDFSYLWTPDEWQKHTDKHGIEWTMNPDLWIPILVKSRDIQGAHDDAGVPLTLEMAMYGDYGAYYTDPYRPKAVNLEHAKKPSKTWFIEALTKATKQSPVTKGTPVTTIPVEATKPQAPPRGVEGKVLTKEAAKPVVVGTCVFSGQNIYEGDEAFDTAYGPALSTFKQHYGLCAASEQMWLWKDLEYWAQSDEYYAKAVQPIVSCVNCGAQYLDEDKTFDGGCISCAETLTSDLSDELIPKAEAVFVVARLSLDTEEVKTFILSPTEAQEIAVCGCGLLKPVDCLTENNQGTLCCETCIDQDHVWTPPENLVATAGATQHP